MTTLHFSLKTGGRGCGAAHARYILRLGEAFASKNHVLWSESGNLPFWARDAIHFFAATDYHERLNGITYREVVIALDRALPVAQQIAISQEYIRMFTNGQKAYLAAIHVPQASDGLPHPHLHLMYSERVDDGYLRPANQFSVASIHTILSVAAAERIRRVDTQVKWLHTPGCSGPHVLRFRIATRRPTASLSE